MKQKEIYKCNGRTFDSYDAVIEYCEANQLRVTNTETMNTKYGVMNFVTVVACDYIEDGYVPMGDEG